MNRPRAIRLLGPAALGSVVLAGAGLLLWPSPEADEEGLRRWDDGEPARLPEVARRAADEARQQRPRVAVLRVTQPDSVRPSAPAPTSSTPSTRAMARASGSSGALAASLASSLAADLQALEPQVRLIPPELSAALAAGEPVPVLSPESTAPLDLPPALAPPAQTETPPPAVDLPQPRFGLLPAATAAPAASGPGVEEPASATLSATIGQDLIALPNPAPPSPALAAPPEEQQAPVALVAASLEEAAPASQPSIAPTAMAAAAPVPEPALALAPPVAAGPPAAAPPATAALAPTPGSDFSAGTQTFPAPRPAPAPSPAPQPQRPAPAGDGPAFTLDDELILQLQVSGISASDTIVAYGNRSGVYLPLGELALILDLAIRVSDDGHYASGWFLAENRTLTVDLRQNQITTPAGTVPLEPGMAQALDGELYLRSDVIAALLPLTLAPDLRGQRVVLTTLEPFPFEERMRREANRAQLAGLADRGPQQEWPREETPYRALSVPMADLRLRGVTDSQNGTRAEGELQLSGDLAFMTAQAFFGGNTRDGLITSLVELGRRDPDGDLLGPLGATEFRMGDVASAAMPLGLRGVAGRGGFITNQPYESASLFDRVDLRGVLPDGYEVELYRNDILLASTAQAVNGQYEFLEVPVDYGLNVFRLVFYGPQGQRREEVRRISVGDGRLSAGEVQYSFGAVQRGVNLLGVEGPDFRPGLRYGSWQANGEVAWGMSSDLTGVASGALYEDGGALSWIAGTGLRSGIGGIALRADAALSDGGGWATGIGLGSRLLGGGGTLSHFEYGGGFVDEVRSQDPRALSRFTQAEFNTTLRIGSETVPFMVPLSARIGRAEFADGSTRSSAGLRASARAPGLMVSNTVEYLRTVVTGGIGFSQVLGNFDLTSLGRGDTQLRANLGYGLVPDVRLTQVGGEVARRFGDRSLVSASASYSFATSDWSLGLSAARDLDRFTLALDGQYAPRTQSYSLGLRLSFSLGRDPLRRHLFVEPPGLASSGALSVRAFQDMDGDRRFGAGDRVLEGVEFMSSNALGTTDSDGVARLTQLGNGNRVSVQADPSTMPDIMLTPVNRGIEIVPRAGRFHVTDYPVVALSELEGTVSFVGTDGASTTARGVSGLRLQLRDASGQVAGNVRTERGGYYFFEQIAPGQFQLVIDPEQAGRLGLCLVTPVEITVPPAGDVLTRDFAVTSCEG